LTERVCVPVPQVTLHVDQLAAYHSYEGHKSVLHVWDVAAMAPAD
jgi:hypothetical protein